ncbi:MAG: transketolase [Chloroflexota bacterium]
MKSLSDGDVERLAAMAASMRRAMVEMLAKAGGGHIGGSMSVIDILVLLYGAVMRVNPAQPNWPDRDRLVLSKGHACAALCPVLASCGFFPSELLDTFNKLDSPFGMHPDMHKIPGCDMSTGSLGHGLAIGLGMALAGRADSKDYRVYVILGDGECSEGSVWEAAAVAAHYRVGNLVAIVDRNRVSLDGNTDDLMSLEPFADRWRSFGWNAIEVDGHDFRQLYSAIQSANDVSSRPTVVIAHTIKGKGISFMEGKHEYHYASLAGAELEKARIEVGR